MAKLFGRLNNLSYRGGGTGTANVVIDDGVITVDVKGSPQDITGACIIDNKVHITRANASPLEMVLPLPQPDLAETNTESLAFVKNKKISYLENDKDYITTSGANKAYVKKVTVNNVEVPILDSGIEQVAQLLVGEGLSVGVNATVSVDTSKIATNEYVDSNTAVVTENITQLSTATQTALNKKVDKVEGKGLSTEDFTTELKDKLDGIEPGAQVNTITGVKGDTESEYRVGNVNITKENIGLGNVDNTSDENKPISTAQQQALDTKTNVTVNGEHVDTFNADTKLDKVTTGTGFNRVYGIGQDGTNIFFNVIMGSSSPNTIVIRNNAGAIVTNTPTADNHAATKKYVDDIANTKLDKVTATDNYNRVYTVSNTGEQTLLKVASGSVDIGTIAQRGVGGTLLIGTPTADGHAATKKYVDDIGNAKLDKVSGSDNAYKIYGTDNNGNNILWNLTYFPQVGGGTIPVINSNRTITVDPAYNFSALKDSDAINKKYVDNTISSATSITILEASDA